MSHPETSKRREAEDGAGTAATAVQGEPSVERSIVYGTFGERESDHCNPTASGHTAVDRRFRGAHQKEQPSRVTQSE